MTQKIVSIVRYEKPRISVQKAVELSGGFAAISPSDKVFIKPNIVFWTPTAAFPKWGVITTSRVVQDMVELLKDKGVSDISIGEGTVVMDPKDRRTQIDAFACLGYRVLEKRYGVKLIPVLERPFRRIDLGDGISLNFNVDILESDHVVDLPVLKTHAQTVVSLGIKNLKGTIDLKSRKSCHSADEKRDLNFQVARLAHPMPPIFTLIDGIYTNERGPSYDGRIRRSDILIASGDILSADLVGARVLGHLPADVPHLAHAARNHGRPLDLSDISIVGESIDTVACLHRFDFPYNGEGTLPLNFERIGVTGLTYRKYDLTLCTYCSFLNGAVLTAVARAWKGAPWEDVEILTGKSAAPTPGMKKTVLLGRCIYQANKNHPDIEEMIAVKGCPPRPEDILSALHRAGIEADAAIFENLDRLPESFLKRYEGRPEFDESFFRIE
ncbi:MAG: DUF362 domain-containing protein [Desulfobacteraceae bacterium]|nr:MAG: DUF362 domain-containing protein [Desulfobacteraceae bacterium]